MTYTKTNWVNGVVPVNQDNLNHAETQYDEAMKDGASRFAPALANKRAQMADAWAADKVAAAGIARVNYEDAPQFVEQWSSLSSWAYTSGKLSVAGNKLYGVNGGSTAGAGHAFPVGPGEKLVYKTSITIVGALTANGDMIFGLNSDAAGAVPTASAATMKGIHFQPSDGTIRIWNQARDTSSSPLGSFTTGTTYHLTVTLDATTISFAAVSSDGTLSVGAYLDRGNWNPNNLALFFNDVRGTSGSYLGPIGAARAFTSIKPRTGIEDLAPFWAHTSNSGTYHVRVALPASYDPRRPTPMVMIFHGSGGAAEWYGSSASANSYGPALAYTNAGYIVVTASLNSSKTTWGSDAGLDAYEYAYRYVRSYFAISNVFFHANSMGGIESMNTLMRGNVPCEAWIGTVPTVSLANNYADNFKDAITASYSIAADGSDFAAKTAGHDPALTDMSFFRDMPIMVVVATDDTSVVPERNWNLVEARVQSIARGYLRVNVTGGHAGGQLNGGGPAFPAFLQQFFPSVLA